jgi:hypothetical protein
MGETGNEIVIPQEFQAWPLVDTIAKIVDT